MRIKDGVYDAVVPGRPDLSFEIRFDFGRLAIVNFNQLSGDLRQVAGTQMTVLDSFRGVAFSDITETQIRVRVQYFQSKDEADLFLQLTTVDGQERLVGSYTQRSGGSFLVGRTFPLAFGPLKLPEGVFRQLVYEVNYDASAGAALDYTFPFESRTVTIEECFLRAGIQVQQQRSALRQIPTRPAYQRADLHGFLVNNIQPPRIAVPFVYFMVATTLVDEDSTTGIMFERETRRGSAVFFDTIQRVAGDRGLFLRKNYIRTAVHELGHTLNLPHAFEGTSSNVNDLLSNRSASATFMNYPSRYTGGRGGPDAYWEAFQFQFDHVELLQLCHGAYRQVMPGVGGVPYIGQTADRAGWRVAADSIPGTPRNGLELKLRLKPERAGNLLEFGEPVALEVKLENRSGAERSVVDALPPRYEFTRYLIRKPSGELIEFRLPFRLSLAPTPAVLTPDRSHLTSRAIVSHGKDGFYFIEPGPYLVQAVHATEEGLITSNVLMLWVRYPTPAQEELIVPTFDDEVADYFALGGSPHLQRALRLLGDLEETLADRAKRARRGKRPASTLGHPLADAYRWCRLLTRTRGALAIDRQTGAFAEDVPEFDHEGFRELAGFAADYSALQVNPWVSNITFSRICDVLFDCLARDGKRAEVLQGGALALKHLNTQKSRDGRPVALPPEVETGFRQRWDLPPARRGKPA
jgi:hypothetical protein